MSFGDGRPEPQRCMYRGQLMRSKLEVAFAEWLDRYDFEWRYEPHAVASDNGKPWLADFVLEHVRIADGSKVGLIYVEVRPERFVKRDNVVARMQGAYAHAEHGAWLALVLHKVYWPHPAALLIVPHGDPIPATFVEGEHGRPMLAAYLGDPFADYLPATGVME